MLALFRTFSWQELRHHPWRSAAAVVAVMLGVALAFSVQLINASALDEFSSAVRSVTGQPDLELRGVRGSFDEAVFSRVANHPQTAVASPVLEISTYGVAPDGRRRPLRVVGIDALVVPLVAPALMPLPDRPSGRDPANRLVVFAPDALFLNAAARQMFTGAAVQLQSGLVLKTAQVAGTVNAGSAPGGEGGTALGVMDIGAAQDLFGKTGQLTRIDLRLAPGTDRRAYIASLALPPDVLATEPGDAAQRISNLSRAYRVNLTVLALVALFTGACLVFSVLSLSVARRAQQLALLGVLGLTARQRLQLVLAESALLGVIGSLAGIALGTVLAATALRLLGGDLGGGYFSGVAPALQWSGAAAAVYGALGVVAALVGGWWPAQGAARLPLAQTLKGLGAAPAGRSAHWISIVLIALGALLALTPPVFGIPLAAYVSVGLLLVGGITALPAGVALLYDRLSPLVAHRLLPLLAIERARRVRQSASVAVSGVVASLSLAVALTVMVASFRGSVTRWLDVVLPADLYVRTATTAGAGDAVYFPPAFVDAVAVLPGVDRVAAVRTSSLLLDPARPAVARVARRIDAPAGTLPLVGTPLAVPTGQIGI